jgi:hypothetical protein
VLGVIALSARHKLFLLLPVATLLLSLVLTHFVSRAYGGVVGGHFLQTSHGLIVIFSLWLVSKLAPGPAKELSSWPGETIAYLMVGLAPAIIWTGLIFYFIIASQIHT